MTKRLTCILLAFSICIGFRVSAYTQDEEIVKVLQQMFGDVDNWICYWQVDVPDRLPSDPEKKTVPGLTGYSPIKFDAKGFNGEKMTLNVLNFIDGYELPILIQTVDLWVLPNDGFTFLEWLEKNNTKGNILPAGQQLAENKFQFPEVSEKSTSIKTKEVNVTEDGELEVILRNSDNGLFIIKDWSGRESFVSGNKLDGKLIYAEKLTLKFYKVNSASFATANFIPIGTTPPSEKTYYIELNNYDSQESEVSISNLFNTGKEFFGEVLKFNHNQYDIAPHDIKLILNKDNTVDFENSTPGMLSMSTFPWYEVSISSGKVESILLKNLGNHDDYLYFQDFVILSADQYLEIKEDLPEINSIEDDIVKAFYDGIPSLETPKGSWEKIGASSQESDVNRHWDRGIISTNLKINFPEVYLLPIRYKGYGNPSSTFFDNYFIPSKDEVVQVEDLELNLVIDGESEGRMNFSLKDFGYGPIHPGSTENYLYISGVKSWEAEERAELYIVRGTINDYDSELLACPEKGHKNGINIESYQGKEITKASTLSTASEVSTYLIPDTVIPTTEGPGISSSYTLYVKYFDESENPRFQTLTTIDQNNVTTGITPNFKESSGKININGNVVTAEDEYIGVFDVAGRLVARIPAGKSSVLPAGIYIARTSGNQSFKIIIKE